jgi:multidrug resistance efflux pump
MAALDLGNGYHIDLAEADKFIAALEAQRKSLEHSLRGTARNLRVRAPGNDDYSGVFANRYNELIAQHAVWNERKQDELRRLINEVRAAVATYRRVESENTTRVGK